jgi:serine/threonine-protein kinase
MATLIQGGTGVPVAGWGLVWSAVAFALPLWALVRRARGHSIEPAWSGVLLTVLAGVASVVVLGSASLSSSEVCTTCVVTYALVLAYAAVCLRATEKLRPAQIRRGALLAVGATLVAFLALLYPGLRTPRSAAAERSAFLEAAKRSIETEEKPVEVAKRSIETEEKPVEVKLRPDAARLDEMISRLSPELRQGLSDALGAYAGGDRVPLRPARRLIGPSTAPVRITEFTDILCSHCAGFHESLGVLREMLPSDSFALEPRQFPLDSECNPAVEKSSGCCW